MFALFVHMKIAELADRAHWILVAGSEVGRKRDRSCLSLNVDVKIVEVDFLDRLAGDFCRDVRMR